MPFCETGWHCTEENKRDHVLRSPCGKSKCAAKAMKNAVEIMAEGRVKKESERSAVVITIQSSKAIIIRRTKFPAIERRRAQLNGSTRRRDKRKRWSEGEGKKKSAGFFARLVASLYKAAKSGRCFAQTARRSLALVQGHASLMTPRVTGPRPVLVSRGARSRKRKPLRALLLEAGCLCTSPVLARARLLHAKYKRTWPL